MDSINIPRYMQVIAERVYPNIAGLGMTAVPFNDRVVVLLTVPGRQNGVPYIVRDRNALLIPFRSATGNRFWGAEDVFGRLATSIPT